MVIKLFTVDHNIDVLAVSETWFHDDYYNLVNMGILCATGYRFLHNPRAVGRGEAVGVLFRGTLQINSIICDTRKTFKLMDVRF